MPALSPDALGAYLALAVQAAREAGQFLLATGGSRVVEVDLPHDVKLAADRDAEEIIVKILRQHSDLPLLAEERGRVPASGEATGLRWIIDPLDGSLNFLQGIPFCCVSIALWRKQKPLLGVVYDFHREELFTGTVGDGACLDGKPIQTSSTREIGKAILCTGFPAATNYAPEALLQLVEQLRRYKKLRLLGSAALSLAYVAAGRADAYFERDIKIWDVAAGLALVKAAGGVTAQTSSPAPFAVTVYAGNRLLPHIEKIDHGESR
jgi:myo-inositol-1(or 4)-monophosphatase